MNQSSESFKPTLSPTVYDRDLPISSLPINNLDVWIGRWPNVPHLRLCWYTSARIELLKHCYETPNIETGGVLLGHIFRTPPTGDAESFTIDFIEITGSIRAETLDAGQGHIRFDERTWARINRMHDRQYAATKILGWYHTHPGHGVFLSSHDLHIHDNFFNQPLQLALVIDTHRHRGAFFVDSVKQKGPYKSNEFEWNQELLSCFMNLSDPMRIGRIGDRQDSEKSLATSVNSEIESFEINTEDLPPESLIRATPSVQQPQQPDQNLPLSGQRPTSFLDLPSFDQHSLFKFAALIILVMILCWLIYTILPI